MESGLVVHAYVVELPTFLRAGLFGIRTVVGHTTFLFVIVAGYQSVHPERAFKFFLAIGALEMLLGQLPITRRRRTAFVVLTTIGSCLLVAAFPYRYSGAALSVSWLVEAEALLLAGILLGEIVFRRLGMLATLLVWIHMVFADAGQLFGDRMHGLRLTGKPGLAFFFILTAGIFYANSEWIPRHWPRLIQSTLELSCFLWLSHLAAALAFIGCWIAWPGEWTAVAWTALGLTLASAGWRWQLKQVSLDALGCTAAAVLRVLAFNIYAKQTYPHAPWLTERLLTISLVVLLLYVASRWVGVGMARAQQISASHTWAASALVALLVWYELRPLAVALGWTLLGLILLEVGLKRRAADLRLQAYVAFAAAFLRLWFVNFNAAAAPGEISPRVYTILPIALAFYYAYVRLVGQTEDSSEVERKFRAADWHSFLGTLIVAALMRFELDVDLVVVAWAALTLLLVAIAWKTGRRIFLQQGLLLSFAVFFRAILHNLYQRSYFPAPFGRGPIVSVGTAVALLFLVLLFAFPLRRLQPDTAAPRSRIGKLIAVIDQRPEQIFFFIPFVLVTALIASEVRVGMVTLAWGVEALAVFSFALWLTERSYRFSGLGLLLICVAKIVFHDVWGLAPRDRYLTFIVLGAALLGVSYLYTRYRDILRQYL